MILKVVILMRFSLLNSTNRDGYFRTSAEIGLSILFASSGNLLILEELYQYLFKLCYY